MRKIVKLTESDITNIVKKVIKESKKGVQHYSRRFAELVELVYNQVEMQDPCNFDDSEEYADFCISKGLCFFFDGSPWGDECNTDEDDEDEDEDEDEEIDYEEDVDYENDHTHVNLDEYNSFENELREKHYDELVSIWEEYMKDGEC